MTKQLILEETVYYLAFQDGPANNDEYDTENEAKEALSKIDEVFRRGICVMSRVKRKHF